MPATDDLWAFLPVGYAVTIALETPVLLLGLSPAHSTARRFFAGVWLTACTYPIVVLVLPTLVWEPFGRLPYLIVAEIFAPLAECLIFYFAFNAGTGLSRRDCSRDMLSIIVANLVSFLPFEISETLSGSVFGT